jgi:hypothetical protein
MLSLQPQSGWTIETSTAVYVENSDNAPSGALLARLDRLVLRRLEEGTPLTLVLTPSQPCQLAAMSITLNARFLELYSEDVYSRTMRGKATESKLVFEISEEFAPPIAVSGSSRLLCKVASVKGDTACVTLENILFSFLGLRMPSKPVGPLSTPTADAGAIPGLPFAMPMMAAAVESIKQELRSSILEDLRIMLDGQSMIMMSKFAQMERRLHALEAAVGHLASEIRSDNPSEAAAAAAAAAAPQRNADESGDQQDAEGGHMEEEETKG